MLIAVNTRLLLSNRLEGIGWFTYESLKRIVHAHPEHDFLFIFDRKPSPEFIFADNVKAVVAHPQARHPILWYLFFEFGVTRVLKKYKPDLFLSPDGWASLRTKTKTLNVIHDLNFEAHPEFIPKYIVAYYRYFFPRFAKKSTRIATVSEYTKQDIHQRYGYDLDKIDVVYNGANDNFKPLTVAEKESVKLEYSEGKDYFLFVGLIHQRKNLENQIRAYTQFRAKNGSSVKFLIVGAKCWWPKEMEDAYSNSPYKNDIVFLGRQSMENLLALYGGALCLMYASFFEGFGIPILEAMMSEIPVITSSTSSMPEICKNAGEIIDPYSVDEIAEAMQKIAMNTEHRNQLIENGRIRRKDFSWDKTASNLWKSIEKTVQT